MFSYRAIYVIFLREFKRFFRQKGRLVVTLSRPLIWLLIVGAGFSGIVDLDGPQSYIQFIIPGIVGMTILFSSIFSTISVVWDKEFGFMREMLVAPISRSTIVMGKLLSGTALSVFQGMVLILLISPFLHVTFTFFGAFQLFIFMILTSMAVTSFGLVIAAYLDSLEGFNVIMNFIVLPMFFLSGALYPVSNLPKVLYYASMINPLSYGVDSLRHVIIIGGAELGGEFPILVDVSFLLVFSLIMTMLASRAFSKRM